MRHMPLVPKPYKGGSNLYISSTGSTDTAYCKVKNGYIAPANDDIICCLGKEGLAPFIQKTQGYSIINTIAGGGAGKGMVMYVNPDPNATDRSHTLYALGNRIFIHDATGDHFVTDVNANFGWTIDYLNGVMRKGKLYLTVGDPTQGTKLLIYDGTVNPPTSRITQIDETCLVSSRLLGVLDDRLLSVGTGANNNQVQYSDFQQSGNHLSFCYGPLWDAGGELSGDIGAVTALEYANGVAYVFEKDKVTIHDILPTTFYDTVLQQEMKGKEFITLVTTIEGMGTYSQRGVTVANDSVYFVDDNGVYQYNHGARKTVELTESFRKCFEGSKFDFRRSSICYDRKRRLLYVTCASTLGGIQDTILIYSVETDSWSYKTGINVNELIWDDIDEKVYGVSDYANGDAYFYDVFDGQYKDNNTAPGRQDGRDQCLSAKTVYDDMRMRDYDKRFRSVVIHIMHPDQSGEFDFRIFKNDLCSPHIDETVSYCASDDCEATQTIGDTDITPTTSTSFQNKLFKYDDCYFTFNKLSYEIEECSSHNFYISYPNTTYQKTSNISISCEKCL